MTYVRLAVLLVSYWGYYRALCVWTRMERTFIPMFVLSAQAVLIFLILLIPVLLVVYEFWMYLSGAVGQSMWLGLVFCCPSLILALVLAYVYPLLAQFDNSIKNTLKNACLLAIGSLPYSLVMAALNLLPVALFLFATSFFFRTAIFWVLIGGALVAFANSWLLRKVFKKNFGLD